MFAKEPPRAARPEAHEAGARRCAAQRLQDCSPSPGSTRCVAINLRGATFCPLFVALALSAAGSQGLPQFARAVHHAHLRLGRGRRSATCSASMVLVANARSGIAFGGLFVSLARPAAQGRQHPRDRISSSPAPRSCTIAHAADADRWTRADRAWRSASILRPRRRAGAERGDPAHRAQRNARPGDAALYLFMFTFFGAIGPLVIGFVSTFMVGDERRRSGRRS